MPGSSHPGAFRQGRKWVLLGRGDEMRAEVWTRRQAGTKRGPFVFLNETGGEKTARKLSLLAHAGHGPKYRDLYLHTPVNTHAMRIYKAPNICRHAHNT